MSKPTSSKSPKVSLATLGLLIATPGVLVPLFYYVVDEEFLFSRIRSPMKRWVDENYLVCVSFVVPSILLFLGCGIFKTLEWANPKHWGHRGKLVRTCITIVWATMILWSLLSLFLFRSSEGHGPDRVGTEVAAFMLPLILATLLSLGFANTHAAQPARFRLLIATAVITLLEIAIYCLAICP